MLIEISCKWCGKKFFKTDSQVRNAKKNYGKNGSSFCSHKCGCEYRKSLHWQARVCQHCGKEYLFELNQEKRKGHGKYCSRKCHYDAGHFKKKCETCGNEFSGLKFYENIRRYCSAKCAGNSISKVELKCVICKKTYFRTRKLAKYSKCCSRKCNNLLKVKIRPVYKCSYCDKNFSPQYPSMAKKYGDKPCCSVKCASQLRRNHNPLKREELRTSAWRKIRKAVIERDGMACVLCGNGIRLCVHHVIPWRIVKEDNPENLITLCASCHGKIERLTDKYFPR